MKKHKVALIMGLQSDWPVMLEEFNLPYDAMVVSAHRTPQRLYEFAQSAEDIYSGCRAGI